MKLFEVLITDMVVICGTNVNENIRLGRLRSQLEEIHPLRQTSRQTHCAEILWQQQLHQNFSGHHTTAPI